MKSNLKDSTKKQREVITNLSFLADNGKAYNINRAKALAELVEKDISGKFLCHIGCHTGVVTQRLSKQCRKILAIDVEQECIDQTSERCYDCPTDIKKADAIKYLAENPDVNPEVFYFWTNKNSMEKWIENIIELRGHTSPTIMLGIGLQRINSQIVDGVPIQLLEAKRLKEKYNGEIEMMNFSSTTNKVGLMGMMGVFGLLKIKGI